MPVSVIGAGPVGCRVAELLARAGEQVTVFEEHKKIGLPTHCTGIVSPRLLKLVKTDSVLNKVKIARFVGKNISFDVKGEAFVIDRAAFDKERGQSAESLGAKLVLGRRVAPSEVTGAVVGADGARSPIRAEFVKYPRLLPAAQYTLRTHTDPTVTELHFSPIYHTWGLFCWVVPIDEKTVRVGVACPTPAPVLEKFIRSRFSTYSIVYRQAGTVVAGGPLRADWGRVKLVGDAAGQVKATTGGGLVPGLICAEACADAIINGKNYEFSCRQTISELKTIALFKRMWDHTSADTKESLLSAVGRHVDFLETCDMDWQAGAFTGMLIREFPTFLRFFLDQL